MTTVLQGVSSDAYVREASPTATSGTSTSLTLTSSAGSAARFSYIYFNRPFPLKVNIHSAVLRLHQKGAAAGGARVISARRAASSWKESTITYDNRPTTVGSVASSASQGDGGADGRVWEIDITAMMQIIADGEDPWYGLRLESDNTTMITLYSSQAATFQPEIEIEFSEAPDVPSSLSPSNGRAVSIARPTLRMDFVDDAGDTNLAAIYIEMNEGAPSETPSFNTGDVATTTPEWQMTFDVAIAEDWYWRGEVVDGAGLRSGLSDWVHFTRTAKPVVAITNPAGFVTEPTPPLIATVTGGTQTAYQWFLTDPEDQTNVLWTSNKVSTADLGSAIPATDPPLLTPGGEYGLLRRTWDDVARESTPGDPVYVDTFTTFTFDLTSAVDPADTFTVQTFEGRPDIEAIFTRATAPDEWVLLLDGVAVDTKLPGDLSTGGTGYAWPYMLASPYHDHEWSVAAVVNGETSDDNPTDTVMAEPVGAWLCTLDGVHKIMIATEGSKPVRYDASEISVVRKPPGGLNPVLITQGVFGREGDVDGFAKPDKTQNLEQIQASWDAMFDPEGEYRGKPMALTDVDATMRVIAYNIVDTPKHEYVDKFAVKFRFFEVR